MAPLLVMHSRDYTARPRATSVDYAYACGEPPRVAPKHRCHPNRYRQRTRVINGSFVNRCTHTRAPNSPAFPITRICPNTKKAYVHPKPNPTHPPLLIHPPPPPSPPPLPPTHLQRTCLLRSDASPRHPNGICHLFGAGRCITPHPVDARGLATHSVSRATNTAETIAKAPPGLRSRALLHLARNQGLRETTPWHNLLVQRAEWHSRTV